MLRSSLILCLSLPLAAQSISTFRLAAPDSAYAARLGREHVPDETIRPGGIAFVDGDGDGLLDLAVGGQLSSSTTSFGFRYYRNLGAGVFERMSPQWAEVNEAVSEFAVADVDGDGDPDIVGTRVLMRNVGGTYVAEWLPDLGSTRRCVTAGDIDGDGDVDLFVGVGFSGGPSRQDRLLINDGAGQFSWAPTTALPNDNDDTVEAAFLDADGDGDLDVVMGIEKQGTTIGGARLYLNDGSGTFASAAGNLSTPIVEVLAVAVDDFDLDGDPDIVLGTGPGGLSQLPADLFYRNVGGGQFQLDSNALPPLQALTADVVAADIDGDGDRDLLLAMGGRSYVPQRVYRNDGAAFVDVTSTWLPEGLHRGGYWAAGDIDGDSDLDAAFVAGPWDLSIDAGRVRLFENRSGSSFVALNAERLPATDYAQLEAAPIFEDVDADGDLDVFVRVGYVSSSVLRPQQLLLNDGQGTFQDASGSLPGPLSVRSARFADTDGDGDRDLLLGTNTGVVLWLSDGFGGFQEAPVGAMPATASIASMCVGDVDGDGDVDVFAGRDSGTSNELLRNDGAGVFTRDPAATPTHSFGAMRDCEMLDYDDDQDLDIVFVLSNNLAYCLQNDGAGQFTNAVGALPAISQVREIIPYDANDDGRIDLVAEHNYAVSILLNTGAGFVSVTPPGTPNALLSAGHPTVFDLEGDGDLDIGYMELGQSKVLLREGPFSYSLAGALSIGRTLGAPPFGADLDQDGDADFYVDRAFEEPTLEMGMRTHLQAPWIARAGEDYQLRAHCHVRTTGPMKLAVFALNGSKLSTPMPLPPYGNLRVEPEGAILTCGLIPTNAGDPSQLGLACTYALPADPGLVGATLYAQALIWTEFEMCLSNLVADPVR